MQIAITSKMNSGCISRQVGAVVTDKHYSIRGIGWNSAPEGQVPCNLRTFSYLKSGNDFDAFSQYERDDTESGFLKHIKETDQYKCTSPSKNGLPLSYCFKSLYNRTKGDKNQVHTRALHAEENAFLQIAKYGGSGLKGGILFTTASPCELCSKKAYQLGITLIYYIDPYPGISTAHILSYGKDSPKLQLFTGAIGRAYVQLYEPMLPLKDELDILFAQEVNF